MLTMPDLERHDTLRARMRSEARRSLLYESESYYEDEERDARDDGIEEIREEMDGFMDQTDVDRQDDEDPR